MTTIQKETCLNNIKKYFEKTHGEFIIAQSNGNLAEIESVLFHARKTLEAVCDYVILEKFPTTDCPYNGEIILKGKDTTGDTVNGHQTAGKNLNVQKDKIVLATRISIIHDRKFFSTDAGENDNYKFHCSIIRYGGNKGAHNETKENRNPSFNDCELVCINLKTIIEWFYRTFQSAIPTWYNDILAKETFTNSDLPKFSEWYTFKSSFNDFQDKTAQYILIIDKSFRQELSDYDIDAFAQSSVNWNLIIDFDFETQQFGLERYFKKVYGKEEVRTINKADLIPDVNALFYFLAQGSAQNQVENNPTKWEKDRNGYGKTLEKILDKIKTRGKVFIVIIGNQTLFIEKCLQVVYGCYSNIAEKINIGVIANKDTTRIELEESIDISLFGSVNFYLFNDYQMLIQQGFALSKKYFTDSNNEFLVPAFTKNERRNTFIPIPINVYKDLKSKNIELLHINIGKEELEIQTNFYLGDEITWQDLRYLGKGKDIDRNKLQLILIEVLHLLQEGTKGLHVYKLNHEASAGGTTVAKKVAYLIGADRKTYNNYPAIIIRQYIPVETAKAIADLYEATEDKPVLAIIEDYEIGEKLIEKLAIEIIELQKKLVVIHVCRTNSNSDEVEFKCRKLPSQLESDEIDLFENVFVDLIKESKPDKVEQIKSIKKGEDKFKTPFIYGITTFGKDFKKLDTYIDNFLDYFESEKIKKVFGFVALIGRYTQNSIPIQLFNNFLGINDIQADWDLLTNFSEEEKEIFEKIFSLFFELEGYTEIRCLKIRNELFAEDISEKLLTSRSLTHRHLWRANLKNWLLELITILKNAYPDSELYPTDKKLIDSLFIDKEGTGDEKGKKTFSKLIEELNFQSNGREDSREILKALTDTFNVMPEDAFYGQHLARLYYDSAKKEQGIDHFRKAYFFDEAIKRANNAINLYLKNPSSDKSLSGLYHTKGHAGLLKIEFINSNFQVYSQNPNFENEVKELYISSSEAFEECLRYDENSTYGYMSYSYLIVQIIDFGRKVSGHQNFVTFLEDADYEWYVDKRDLGIEIITKANDFWSKYSSNKSSDFQTTELKRRDSYKDEFQEKINQNYSRLLILGQIDKKNLLSKVIQAPTKAIKILWQNAYIDKMLGDKNFSNYNLAFVKLNKEELKEIVELLRINLEQKPNLRDLKRWLRAVRINTFSIDITTSINFLEYIHKIILDNQNQAIRSLLLENEINYYLYCLNFIQILNEGESVDNKKVEIIQNLQSFCNDSAKRLALRRTHSFEWLGKNKSNGFEQLISRDKLGDFKPQNNFFKDISELRELQGVITTIRNKSANDVIARQSGKIQIEGFDLTAFFVPIHGGFIETAEGKIEKCVFDNSNNINVRVKFFIGFSFDGLRAYQPIPVDSIRANLNKAEELSQEAENSEKTKANYFKIKVIDVYEYNKKIIGSLIDTDSLIDIAFAQNKTYYDYKYLIGQVITIELLGDNKYKIIDFI